MLKDRGQKAAALRYTVARRWFPQLELELLAPSATSMVPKSLTDIDVFATAPDEFGSYRTVAFDCKTSSKESPIGRVMWMRGVMHQMGVTKGFCVLRRPKIEGDHRRVAAAMGVTLLTENEFEVFANATCPSVVKIPGALTDIDRWEVFLRIPSTSPGLESAIVFSRRWFWLCSTPAEACRKSVAALRNVSGELDPAKPLHSAVVCDLAALFTHATARLVAQVFTEYLHPRSREELAEALLLLLYGGREVYEHRNALYKLVKETSQQVTNSTDLTLPNWNGFVQFIRQCLDAPTECARAPLILRELGWAQLSEPHESDLLRNLAMENRQAAKFALLSLEFLCVAANLPPEFRKDVGGQLLAIQSPPSITLPLHSRLS